MQEFNHEKGKFESMPILDKVNLRFTLPKYFRSKVVSHSEVVFMGGCDEYEGTKGTEQLTVASNRAYKVTNGVLEQLPNR